jgi:signal transduction histidine kinase
MWSLIFFSGDPQSKAEVKALLPEGAGLEEYATLRDVPRPSASGADEPADKVILVDLSGAPIPAGQLEPFRRVGIPTAAWIGAPEQREAAWRAGFDEYLLRPCSKAEALLRFTRLRKTAGAADAGSARIDRERQAAVGRLTSFFCHAVNNSIQTIRGSVDLAREEPDLPDPVAEYLTICRKETVSIGAKIDRLRQIYRPRPAPPEPVALGALLHEALQMAADELLRANVTAREQFESGLPDMHGSPDRLALAFLLILSQMAEDLGPRGGGELLVRTAREPGALTAAFCAGPDAGTPAALPPGLEPALELIRNERGRLEAFSAAGGLRLTVRFPAGGGG